MAVRRAHMRAHEGRSGGAAPSLAARSLGGTALALTLLAALSDPAGAGGTLTVGMTAGDIPVTTGNPDQGFEGYRFVGYNLYDALLLWDLSKADKPSEIKPGLATSYEIDPNDHKRWIVHLRQGVTFHDGCNSPPTTWCGTTSTAPTRKRRISSRSNWPTAAPG
jgi:ABC-type transport system substrate-binding protein